MAMPTLPLPLLDASPVSLPRPQAQFKPVKVFPDQLYLEPTSVCNLHCGMCYANIINGANRRTLSYEQVTGFVARMMKTAPSPLEVYWCGTGEAFLHKDFPRMVNRLLEYDGAIEQTIQTNGTVQRFKEFTSLKRIDFNVSVDGPKDLHEWHRGPKTYDRTMRFCNEALDLGCRTLTVRCLLTRDNIVRLEEFHQDLTERLGPRFILECNPPYDNTILHKVRAQAEAIVQKDIDDSRSITREEARQICADKYKGKFEVCICDTVDNYLSVNTYGVYTCCHGVLKIGDIDDDVPTLIRRMYDSEEDCLTCGMYPCQ